MDMNISHDWAPRATTPDQKNISCAHSSPITPRCRWSIMNGKVCTKARTYMAQLIQRWKTLSFSYATRVSTVTGFSFAPRTLSMSVIW